MSSDSHGLEAALRGSIQALNESNESSVRRATEMTQRLIRANSKLGSIRDTVTYILTNEGMQPNRMLTTFAENILKILDAES